MLPCPFGRDTTSVVCRPTGRHGCRPDSRPSHYRDGGVSLMTSRCIDRCGRVRTWVRTSVGPTPTTEGPQTVHHRVWRRVYTERPLRRSITESGDVLVHGPGCWSGHGDGDPMSQTLISLRTSDPITPLVSVTTTLNVNFFDMCLVR